MTGQTAAHNQQMSLLRKAILWKSLFFVVMKVDSLIPPSAAIFMGPINLQEYKPESAFSSFGDIIFCCKKSQDHNLFNDNTLPKNSNQMQHFTVCLEN